MEYVLIDPRMFMLQNEEAAKENIDFFRYIISLSNTGQISVCLYKEILDQLNNREINPFPININEIKDLEFKAALLQLNYSFVRTILNNHFLLDIDDCEGTQEFVTSRSDLEKTNEYYALFGMLLTPCYSKQELSDKILIGKLNDGIIQGEQLEIECSCGEKQYKKKFLWTSPEELLSERQHAKEGLRKLLRKDGLYVESPETKKGQHHNKIQKDDFNSYSELCAKNKRVLNYLRYFGLCKIIFADFSPDTTYEYGAIKIINVEETSDWDIVVGWLYGCLDFRVKVNLYFPKGIGGLLNKYFDGEMLQKEVHELLTSFGKV